MSLTQMIRRSARAMGVDIAPAERQNTLSTHLLRVFGGLGINCILDVGAHRGEYAMMLREIGYRGAIVSFEPVGENHAVLAANAERDAAWRTHRLALSARDGSAEMRVASQTVYSSLQPFSAHVEKLDPTLKVARTESVPTRRLDGFLAEAVAHIADPRIFLKMDTQGHDLQVLEGARGVLDRILGIQTEASVRLLYEGVLALPEYLARLRDLGFTPSGFYAVTREPDELRLLEVDVIAIRGD